MQSNLLAKENLETSADPASTEAVLITGGAQRLGRAIAVACAGAGANVGITYRTSANEAWELVAQLYRDFPQQKFAAFEADVCRAADLENVAEQAGRGLGPVTALVNNAAIFRRTPFAKMTEADFDDHIAANLKGPYLASKIFGDIFLDQGRGSILNIADIHGLRPLKNYIPYCVSKAGVVMLTEALAKALAPTVRVNCICPGTIFPPSESQGDAVESIEEMAARIPMGRLGTPEEIAAAALFLLLGPAFVTGVVLPVDGAQRLR